MMRQKAGNTGGYMSMGAIEGLICEEKCGQRFTELLAVKSKGGTHLLYHTSLPSEG